MSAGCVDVTEYVKHQLALAGHHEPPKDAPLAIRARYILRVHAGEARYCNEVYAHWMDGSHQTDIPVVCTLPKGHDGDHGHMTAAQVWDEAAGRYVIEGAK